MRKPRGRRALPAALDQAIGQANLFYHEVLQPRAGERVLQRSHRPPARHSGKPGAARRNLLVKHLSFAPTKKNMGPRNQHPACGTSVRYLLSRKRRGNQLNYVTL